MVRLELYRTPIQNERRALVGNRATVTSKNLCYAYDHGQDQKSAVRGEVARRRLDCAHVLIQAGLELQGAARSGLQNDSPSGECVFSASQWPPFGTKSADETRARRSSLRLASVHRSTFPNQGCQNVPQLQRRASAQVILRGLVRRLGSECKGRQSGRILHLVSELSTSRTQFWPDCDTDAWHETQHQQTGRTLHFQS